MEFKIENVLAIMFVVLVYVMVFVFKTDKEVVDVLVMLVKDSVLMILTFFFAKHQLVNENKE